MVDLLAFKVFIPFCSLSLPIPSLFDRPPHPLTFLLLSSCPPSPHPMLSKSALRNHNSLRTTLESSITYFSLFYYITSFQLIPFFISFHKHFLLLPLRFLPLFIFFVFHSVYLIALFGSLKLNSLVTFLSVYSNSFLGILVKVSQLSQKCI